MSRAAHLRWHASVALVLALALVGLFAAQAQAQSPWWGLVSEVEPTHLAPGKPGVVVAAVSDLSYIEAEGTPSPMTIIDRLPPGLSPVSVTASAGLSHPPLSCSIVGSTVKCAYSGPLASYERLEAAIAVNVGASPGHASERADGRRGRRHRTDQGFPGDRQRTAGAVRGAGL